MQANQIGASPVALVPNLQSGTAISDRPFRIAVVAAVLLGVWIYARFSDQPVPAPTPSPVVGAFSEPESFIAAPGVTAQHIHVRSGPGAEYRILETLDRGTALIGIARTTDTNGAFWIQLANNRGFAKETVLMENAGVAAP